MSSQNAVPAFLFSDAALKTEAEFYAKCLMTVATATVKAPIAEYGCHIINKTKPTTREQVDFYRAMADAQANGYLPGYATTAAVLKDYPDRYGQFEDQLARAVAEAAIGAGS